MLCVRNHTNFAVDWGFLRIYKSEVLPASRRHDLRPIVSWVSQEHLQRECCRPGALSPFAAVAMPVNSLGSFDPDTLAVLYQAFDDVWLQLEETTRPDLREATRNAIATALIDAAMSGERDPERLWCHAMRRGRAVCTLDWMAEQDLPQPDLPKGGVSFLRLSRRAR